MESSKVQVPNLRSFGILKKLILNSLTLTAGDQGIIYGEQNYDLNFHKLGFTHKSLESLLNECGICTIKRVGCETNQIILSYCHM